MSGIDYSKKTWREIDSEIEEEITKAIEGVIRDKTGKCSNESCEKPEGRYLKKKSNQKYCSDYCRLSAWRKSKKVNKDE